MIEDLFPVALDHEQLNLNTERMAKYCLDMQKVFPGVVVSNNGGWQSPPLKGRHEPLEVLFSSIHKHAKIYQEILKFKHPLQINPLWININGYKDYNIEHIHPHAVASGVFYIKIPPLDKNDGALKFVHPLGQFLEYDWPYDSVSEPNKYNTNRWFIPPKVNQLLLFPGWINHTVTPHHVKDEDRISISFNLTRLS